MDGLKLFVVGESSGDPAVWGGELPWALVVARDAAEAARMAPEAIGDPIEVSLSQPKLLIYCSGNGGESD